FLLLCSPYTSLILTQISLISFFLFFFNDTATTEIYTLSLHDALPIYSAIQNPLLAPTRSQLFMVRLGSVPSNDIGGTVREKVTKDRKSTRLNSSHVAISYAVFCLKKKKKKNNNNVGNKTRA